MEVKNSAVIKILYMLLGVFIGNDIFYFLHTGNTYLNFTILLSLLLLIVNIISDQSQFWNVIKYVDKYVKIFFLIIVFSIFMSAVFFGAKGIRSWSMGMIDLFFAFSVYVNAMMSGKFSQQLFKGIFLGFLLNIAFSFIQFVLYKSGNPFTFATMFPNPAFQQNIYWYRSQGLFLETSHYLSYLSCVFPLTIIFAKDKTIRLTLIILSILLSLYLLLAVGLAAGSTMMYIMAIVATFFSLTSNKINKVNVPRLFLIIAVLISGTIYFFSHADTQTVKRIFELSFETASLSDKDNIIRNTCMKSCFISGLKNPLGYGFNSSALYINNYLTLSVSSPFNYLVQMLLELGYLGAIIYITIIIRLGATNVINGIKTKNNDQVLIGIAVVFAFICQFAMGRFLYPYICMVYGLANLERCKYEGEQRL